MPFWMASVIVGMRQVLIDPAASHHVAAEEKVDRVRVRH
jgi:hypothetical protein